jgi:hypothetical protein
MTELPDVPALQMLEPPPGGIAILRERLSPRRRWFWLAVPALAAAAALLLLRREPVVAPPPSALADPQVGENFYWVASTPGPRDKPRAFTSFDDVPKINF